MQPTIHPAALDDIEPAIQAHLAQLAGPTDSYYEDHILRSNHYLFKVGEQVAGFASIHEQTLITQFALDPAFRHLGQQAYFQLRRTESARSALVPTSDEFYLAHALDAYRSLATQALFFTATPARERPAPAGFRLQAATAADASAIREDTGDFLEPVESTIDAGKVFFTLRNGNPVGFGILDVSRLRGGTASIGMFTGTRFRGQGVATATISLLIEECRRRQLEPVAGCWYANHASQRTLEAAGMYTGTRLLRFEF